MSRMQNYSDDAPKMDPVNDDALGYGPFSERLSIALREMNSPNGYVVGLHGPWGSGKSTVLNFVESNLDKLEREASGGRKQIAVLRFEPWIVSGYQDLASAFFKLLSERIADGKAKKNRWWQRTARAIKLGANPVIDAAATLGATIDQTGGVASRATGNVAKKSLESAVDKWLEEPSLQSSYDDLVARLAVQSYKYIVLIDDIDRLTSEEIRSIMQMVKTIGKLPNVIYLLAYDRDIVWSALDSETKGLGHTAFAEKIIQHEVELPKPPKHLIVKMLNEATSFLPDPSPDSLRWAEMVNAGILRWVKSPRDVIRYANALKFSWPALEGEIDPQDLFCVEGLRLFERPIYEWIRRHRDFLLGDGLARLYMTSNEDEAGSQFRSALPDESRDEIITLLCALFPNKRKFFRGNEGGVSNEMWFQVVQRRGIATKAGFDSYFSLAPIPTAIPKALIDFAMDHLDDEAIQQDCIEAAFEKLDEYGNTLVSEYLQEIQYRLTSSTHSGSQALLNTLINKYDRITQIDWNGDIFGPTANLHFLIVELLNRWEPEKAADAIETAIGQARSISAVASLVADRAREHRLLPNHGGSEKQIVPVKRVELMGKDLAARFERAAGTDELDDASNYYDIVRIWSKFGSQLAARDWLSAISNSSPKRLAKVADGLLGYSRTSAGRQYSLSERPDDTYYDRATLLEAAERFEGSSSLSFDEQRKITALKKGLQHIALQDAQKTAIGKGKN